MGSLDGFSGWLLGWFLGRALDAAPAVVRGSRAERDLQQSILAASLFAARRALEARGERPSDGDVLVLAERLEDFAGQAVGGHRPDEFPEPADVSLLQALDARVRRHFAVLDNLSVPGSDRSQAQVLGIDTGRFADDFVTAFVAAVHRFPSLTDLANRLGDVELSTIADFEERVAGLEAREGELEPVLALALELSARLATAAGGVDRFTDAVTRATDALDTAAGRLAMDGDRAGENHYRAAVQELRRRTGTLRERDEDLAALQAFATGTEGYRWVVGGPWAGKTALMAELLHACPAEVDWVAYFLRRPLFDADSGRFLRVVRDQLAWLLDAPSPQGVEALDAYRHLWAAAAQRAEERGRHLLLVVDGLDEDMGTSQNRSSVAALLPTIVGDYAHVLASSRPHPRLPVDVDVDHPLRRIRQIELSPSPHAQELKQRALLELRQLLQDNDPEGLARPCLGLLAAAEGALSIDDLTEMLGFACVIAKRWQVEHMLTVRIARIVRPTGDYPDERYGFSHDTLREQSVEFFSSGREIGAYRLTILAWAEDKAAQRWPPSTSPYLFHTYPRLLGRHDPQRLAALLQDMAYLDRQIPALSVEPLMAAIQDAAASAQYDGTLAAVKRWIAPQAYHFGPSWPVKQHGFVPRQLCMQALANEQSDLADDACQYLSNLDPPRLIPQWMTRPASDARSTLTGHTSWVTSAALSVKGRCAVAGSADGTVTIWDIDTGDPVGGPLVGHNRRVAAVALDAEGTVAISCSWDESLRVWDLRTRQAMGDPLRGHHWWVGTVAMTPDGTRAVSGSHDGTLRIWDLVNRRPVGAPLTGHRGWVAAAAISADGQRVVSTSGDGTLRIWDLNAGQSIGEPLRNDAWRGLAITPDGRLAVTGGGRTVIVWDLVRGRPIRELVGHLAPHQESVTIVAITAEGSHVVSGSEDRTLRVWEVSSGKEVLTAVANSAITAVALGSQRPDMLLVTGEMSGAVTLWGLDLG